MAVQDQVVARIARVRDESLNYEAIVIVDEGSGDSLELQRSLVFDPKTLT